MIKPSPLSNLFNDSHFESYPLVEIPQIYLDDRGVISNIADGQLGDVAFITCTRLAVRANHVHQDDWHLTYLVNGEMIYQWLDKSSLDKEEEIRIAPGQLFYTPPATPHKMTFLRDSSFIAISGLNRDRVSYESDTKRLPKEFFSNVQL